MDQCMIAPGNHVDLGFAARSTTLPKPKTLGNVGFCQKLNDFVVNLQLNHCNVEGGSRPSPTE